MATVYVVTAGSGETYRIERVDLASDQACGFAQAYNGIAPVEPVHVEERQTVGRRRPPSRAPSGARSGVRASLPASVAARRGTPIRANALTTSPFARSGGPARSCRRQGGARRSAPVRET